MTEGTLEEDLTQEFLEAGSIPDSPAVIGNKQQELNWTEIIDSPIESPSLTSGSASVIASPVASTIGSQFWTGLSGSTTASGSPIVGTVLPVCHSGCQP